MQITVTSPQGGSGKSEFSLQIAQALASALGEQRKIVLVEAEFKANEGRPQSDEG